MDERGAIEKDIDNLYSRVNKHSEHLARIDAEQPYIKDILERSVKSTEQLSKTMQDMQTSMALMNESIIRMNNKMDDQSKEFEEMQIRLADANAETNKRIDAVRKEANGRFIAIDDRVEKVEDRTKFDFWPIMRKYWYLVLASGLAGCYWFVDTIEQYIH